MGGFSCFFNPGISVNYSYYSNMYNFVAEDKPDDYGGYTIYGGGAIRAFQFNMAYNFGSGLIYRFKNGKSLFLEADYKMTPNIELGINNDRVALFIIKSGISFPFNKTKRNDGSKN